MNAGKTRSPDLTTEIDVVRLEEELQSKRAELELLTAIQAGVASGLEIDAIFEIAGERLAEIFPDKGVALYTYDPETQWGEAKYILENGVRHYPPPFESGPIGKKAAETKQPLLISNREEFEVIGATTIEGTEPSLSGMYTPLIVNDKAMGALNIESTTQEHAFDEVDLRLVTTIARSLSVALDNARLLAETQQRASELAIINDVQAGLVARVELQEIYDLVGERVKEIFDAQVVVISHFDLVDKLNHYKYAFEAGERLYVDPQPFNPIIEKFIEDKQTLLMNEGVAEWMKAAGAPIVAGEQPLSVLSVPLIQDDQVLGSVSLQNISRENAFDASDVQLLETLAASLSVALENARLFTETEERNAELAIINTVQRALAAKLDIQGIYEAVGEKLLDIFDSQTIAIYSADIPNRIITNVYAFEKGQRLEPVTVPFSSLHDHLISLNDTYVFNGNFPEFAAQFEDYRVSAGEMPKSLVGVPVLKAQENDITVTLSLQDIDGGRTFTESDVRLLETLASSMSVALENARLFDETQHLLEETEARATELASINAVGQALVAESEVDALIKLIGEKMRLTFAADIVYVALLQPDENLITFPYTYGEALTPIKLGEGLTSKILQSGEPLLINKEMEKRRAEMGIEQVGIRARSYLGVPIQIGGQTFGVISVQSTSEEDRFDEGDLRLLMTIAANVGAALRNAQLFDEVRHQKQYYQAVIQNSPAAIVLLDMQANVSGWNPAAERLFGYAEAEALGRNIDDLVAFSAELHAEAVRYSEKALAEKSVHLLTQRTRKDGSLVDVEVSGLPVSVDGEYVGFIAIYHDVTEIQQARQAAEEANQAKSIFLANMSHELRTPLNAIIGFSRIVRREGKGVLPEKQVENLDKVLVSADHLLGLIDSVLDISKIEAGRMDVQPTHFALPPVVDLVADTSEPLLREGVQLHKELQVDLPELYTDEDKLKQILLNLVSNAAKFTHEGVISLSCRCDGDWLYVDVNDTGIGVSEEALNRIFEEFKQADSSTTRLYGGTGLGLPISRNLARLLGGDLTACSIQGEGSTFTLTIPTHYQTKDWNGSDDRIGVEE